MKIYSILLIIFLFGITLHSQQPSEPTEQVAQAVRLGNADLLSTFFGPSVDITLIQTEGTYSKTQAMLIMKDFFTRYPPDGFEIKHQGSSDNGSQYLIGNYSSSNITYRTYILLKKVADAFIIQQIQFEEE
ncbi:MAG: DUF4783 domain-containing protein [Bacteroidales bacterium]|nr:DUF4783 domain-containing protein [Lentimicrobiaceae bacterium]MDD5695388.1 DUF4783 domain-containing protein [Bacteroidales bacterium]